MAARVRESGAASERATEPVALKREARGSSQNRRGGVTVFQRNQSSSLLTHTARLGRGYLLCFTAQKQIRFTRLRYTTRARSLLKALRRSNYSFPTPL